jgi:hypothetical protein
MIHGDAAVFCPYCPANLTPAPPSVVTVKKSGFPRAAGILTIIAACMTIIIGIIGIVAYAEVVSSNHYSAVLYDSGGSFSIYWFMFMGVFGILGFAFGLTGGICALKRRAFRISVFGTGVVLISGFATIISYAAFGDGAWVSGFLFGLVTILLSILGIVFLGASNKEFGQRALRFSLRFLPVNNYLLLLVVHKSE